MFCLHLQSKSTEVSEAQENELFVFAVSIMSSFVRVSNFGFQWNMRAEGGPEISR
jgi:hypothetical protein